MAVVCAEAPNRFEVISKERYLQGKLSESSSYFEVAGGMRCCDLKVGNGKVASRGQFVGVHFEGFRLNGRPLESTWARGPSPVFIEAGHSPDFPALGEGVIGMREGGKREIIVPPSMGRPGMEEVVIYKLDLFVISSSESAPEK